MGDSGEGGGTDMYKLVLGLGKEVVFCLSLWQVNSRLSNGLDKTVLFLKLVPLANACIFHFSFHLLVSWPGTGSAPIPVP